MLNGLILVGGKSTRLGQDKYLVPFHGVPQYQHLFQIFQKLKIPSFLSCNVSQKERLKEYPLVVDQNQDIGPLGGIVSAFQQYPNRAFLVLACDMPLVDELTISALAANRQKEVDCTSYRLKNSKYFEATFTIYEYSAFEYMKRRQEAGQYGLQAIIGHLKHHVVEPANEQVFVNVNDQQSLEYVQQLLGRKLLD